MWLKKTLRRQWQPLLCYSHHISWWTGCWWAYGTGRIYFCNVDNCTACSVVILDSKRYLHSKLKSTWSLYCTKNQQCRGCFSATVLQNVCILATPYYSFKRPTNLTFKVCRHMYTTRNCLWEQHRRMLKWYLRQKTEWNPRKSIQPCTILKKAYLSVKLHWPLTRNGHTSWWYGVLDQLRRLHCKGQPIDYHSYGMRDKHYLTCS